MPNLILFILNIIVIFCSYKILIKSNIFYIKLDDDALESFDYDVNTKLLKKKQNISILIFFFLVLFFGILSYKIFILLTNFKISLIQNIVFVATPFKEGMIVPSLFSGLIFSTIFYFIFLKIKLKDTNNKYYSYYVKNYLLNYDNPLARFIYLLCIIVISILFMGFVNWFTVFKSDEILINNIFGLSHKVYTYKQIANFKEVNTSSEKQYPNIHYEIVFSDGNKWSTENDAYNTFNGNKNAIKFIEKLSGMKIKKYIKK